MIGHRIIAAGIACAALSQPAVAQQILEVSDGGVVSGYVSASGVTRLTFTGDAAASSPKAEGGAGPGFSLVQEPATGDLYLTLSREPRPGERAGAVSFFVTTKAGFTYQVELAARDVPSTQIEVRNPDILIRRAERAAAAAPLEARVVTLTRAMWNWSLVDGYEVERPVSRERAAGSLRLSVSAVYTGADINGRVLRVRNPSRGDIEISESLFMAPGVLAVALKGPSTLLAGRVMEVIIVDRVGAAQGEERAR